MQQQRKWRERRSEKGLRYGSSQRSRRQRRRPELLVVVARLLDWLRRVRDGDVWNNPDQRQSAAERQARLSQAVRSSLYLSPLSLSPLSLSLTHAHAPSLARYCNSTLKATLPKRAWTLNIDAVEGSEEDSYRFNPWRAPGHAPVVDPCGQAGGEYGYQHLGGDSVFYNTSMSSMGMRGSELPATPSALRPTWTAGTSVEVAWGARYNHGFVCCCCCECS
jgi:hypothetical protein